MICPKCQHHRTANDDPAIPNYQCPSCNIVYAKYGKSPISPIYARKVQQKTSLINSAVTVMASPFLWVINAYVDAVRDNGGKHVAIQPSDSDIMRDTSECARHKTNHILHFLISLVTFGGWSIIWFVVAVSNTIERNKIHRKYYVEEEGNVAGSLALFVLILLVFMGILQGFISK